MGFEATLWRAIAVYRAASLVYAGVLISLHFTWYAHPVGGWLVLGVMTVWTAIATYAYADPVRRGWPLLIADLAVAVACLLATGWVESAGRLLLGAPNLPVSWVAAPVLAWAVAKGRRGGVIAAGIVALADYLLRTFAADGPTQSTFNGAVLLLLAGVVGGHVARLALHAETRLAQAVELEAATRERERLARGIHDSVLQVLSLVQRRGGELGGEAAELGRLAGEQEATLRALIGSGPPRAEPDAPGITDLGPLLTARGSTKVTVSTPATPVRLPARTATEVAAAVGAALDNVRRHCGADARAWVLVEDAADHVIVSVRDEGPGIEPGRLDQAAADGRLGIAQSICGRIEDLGGTVTIASAPGQGTEIEMIIPTTPE
jgi:signal transduction histidine kinase